MNSDTYNRTFCRKDSVVRGGAGGWCSVVNMLIARLRMLHVCFVFLAYVGCGIFCLFWGREGVYEEQCGGRARTSKEKMAILVSLG